MQCLTPAAMDVDQLPESILRHKLIVQFGQLMAQKGWQDVHRLRDSVADNYLLILHKVSLTQLHQGACRPLGVARL